MKAVAHAARLRTAVGTFTLANWADLGTEYRFGEPTATCIQADGTRIAYDLNVPRHSWL